MTRAPWQDQYLFDRTSTITSESDFSVGGLGLAAHSYVLPVIGHPDIFPRDKNTILRDVADGNSLHESAAVGTTSLATGYGPKFTLTFEATPAILGAFFQLLFQGGMVQGGSPKYRKTCTAWTSSSVDPNPPVNDDGGQSYYANILRRMSHSSSESILVSGAIVESARVYGFEDSMVMVDFTFLGRKAGTNFDESTIYESFYADPAFLFSDCEFVTFTGSSSDSISAFEVRISNNATVRRWNDQEIYWIGLGRLTAQAVVTLPWSGGTVDGASLFGAPGVDTADNYDFQVQMSKSSGGNDYLFSVEGGHSYRDASVVLTSEVEAKITMPLTSAGLSLNFRVLIDDYIDRS